MTTAPANLQPPQPGAALASASLGTRLFAPESVAKIALLVIAFSWYFFDWLWRQHRFAATSEDWTHAYFIPLISLYLLYLRRDALTKAPVTTFWPALGPFLLGVVCYVFFVVGSTRNHTGQGFALVLTLGSMTLLLLGPRVFTYAALPIGYLVFAITISERLMREITFPLQLIASQGSYVTLNLMGITTDIQGNVLEIVRSDGSIAPLNVAAACSGMRMLIAFLALGGVVALVGVQHWWQRVVLLALAAPLALGLNVVRVVVLGVASLWDANLATGEAHGLIGTLLLIPGFFIYMALVWALNRSITDQPAAAKAGAAS